MTNMQSMLDITKTFATSICKSQNIPQLKQGQSSEARTVEDYISRISKSSRFLRNTAYSDQGIYGEASKEYLQART